MKEIEDKEKAETETQIKRQKELTAKAQTTASGLKYYIEKEGSGELPKQGDSLQVHYTLRLNDGQILDSSYDRDQPLVAQVGVTHLIQGWMEALTMFKKGTKVFLIIPPELGYGAQGAGGVIPPNATLYFDMEILE
jgi:peptidyl-prolyl cis-trans isomerase A (cyclophilin A)